jgi:hypothetical protein
LLQGSFFQEKLFHHFQVDKLEKKTLLDKLEINIFSHRFRQNTEGICNLESLDSSDNDSVMHMKGTVNDDQVKTLLHKLIGLLEFFHILKFNHL